MNLKFKSKKKDLLPPPLVGKKEAPLTWARQQLAILGVKGVGSYIGVCVIAALYYIILETHVKIPFTHETNTEMWHHLSEKVIHNHDEAGELRHTLRGIGEGFLAGILLGMFTYNHYKNSKTRAHHHELSLKEGLLVVPKCIAAAAPGFFGALAVVWFVKLVQGHHHGFFELFTAHTGTTGHHTLLQKLKLVYTEDWPKKLVGLSAALFFGHRPARGFYDDLQLWFAKRRLEQKKTLSWWHIPTFKARYNEENQARMERVKLGWGRTPSEIAKKKKDEVVILTSCAIALGLGGYGWYVLNFIAK